MGTIGQGVLGVGDEQLARVVTKRVPAEAQSGPVAPLGQARPRHSAGDDAEHGAPAGHASSAPGAWLGAAPGAPELRRERWIMQSL